MTLSTADALTPYCFEVHGFGGAFFYDLSYRRPQSRPRSTVLDYTRDAIVNRRNLVRVFKERQFSAGQGAGIDGLRLRDISVTEFGDIAERIVDQIERGVWRPRPARIHRIPKDSGGYRYLSIRCAVERILSTAVAKETIQQIDRHLLDGCTGFRPGRSIPEMLAEITYRAEVCGCTFITQDDIRNAFPSVLVEHAVEDYSRHVADPQLLQLIGVIIRGDQQSRTIGLDQGDSLSPPTLNLRLHYCLDLPLSVAVPDNTFWYRYADNIFYLSRSAAEGNQALSRARCLLQEAQFELKGIGNSPQNLLRQGTRIPILGLLLGWNGSRIEFSISRESYHKLALRLERVHEEPKPTVVARRVIQGWIESLGSVFESGEALQSLRQVRQIAADTGFREIGTYSQLEDWADKARIRWIGLKERVWQRLQQGNEL
ncbi:reverse transcriptase domain-containing protein [Blastopirellula marina]|nr:reverse transcriptase domain-containing protein [Blastopirellula marina]